MEKEGNLVKLNENERTYNATNFNRAELINLQYP